MRNMSVGFILILVAGTTAFGRMGGGQHMTPGTGMKPGQGMMDK